MHWTTPLSLSHSLGNGPPGRSTAGQPAWAAWAAARQCTLSAAPGWTHRPTVRVRPPVPPIPTVRSIHRTHRTTTPYHPAAHCQHIASRPFLPTSSSTWHSSLLISPAPCISLPLNATTFIFSLRSTTSTPPPCHLSYLPPHRPFRPLSISNACRRPCLIRLNFPPPSSSLDQSSFQHLS